MMILSDKIKETLNIECKVFDEKPVETLAILTENPGKKYASFIDREKFLKDINENVAMLIVSPEMAELLPKERAYGVCVVDGPRNVFFRLHNALATGTEYARPVSETIIGKGCQIHPSAVIAEKNVIIGDNVIIEDNVSIKENTKIGNNCIIRSGCRIGMEGFEFKRDGDIIFGVRHLGGVVLENDVELQGNVVVDKALYPWDDTILGEYTKVDDLVHIGHGVKLGKGVMVVTLSAVGGRTRVGDKTWIGIGATVRNGITVGTDSRVNMGAVVSQNVEDGEAVTGNFAIRHDKFISRLKAARDED